MYRTVLTFSEKLVSRATLFEQRFPNGEPQREAPLTSTHALEIT